MADYKEKKEQKNMSVLYCLIFFRSFLRCHWQCVTKHVKKEQDEGMGMSSEATMEVMLQN